MLMFPGGPYSLFSLLSAVYRKTAEEHAQWVPANGKRRLVLLLKPTKYVESHRGTVTWLSQISVPAISKITVQRERLKQSFQAGHTFANVTSEV